MTAAGAAGKTAFTAKSCDTCHSGVDFTDGQRHDVGTIQSSSGQGIGQPLAGVGFDTPTLKGLWQGAPYLHNGQAATLDDVLNNSSHVGTLTSQEKSDLVQYLLQIDDIEAPPPITTYLSDLTETSATNAWGPFEKDMSNGESSAGDGLPITLNGVTYLKGLGVHAASEIIYNLGGSYQTFLSHVGIDDEITDGQSGDVTFEVWTDGTKVFDSGVVGSTSAAQSVNVSVTGVNELRLVVTDGGDNINYDHGDWADARVTTGGGTPPPTLPSPAAILPSTTTPLSWMWKVSHSQTELLPERVVINGSKVRAA